MIEALESRSYLSANPVAADSVARSHIPIAISQPRAIHPVPQDLRAATDLSRSTTGIALDKITSIPWRLFVPTLDSPKQKVPLILYLHGYGDGGTDNIAQAFWMSALQQATASGPNKAFVLAPQLPYGWVYGYPGNQPQTEGMNLALIALKQAMKNPNVDLSRIYVTGVSMGGYGVWDVLRRHPKLFAAGVPMSYGGDTDTAKTIAAIPIWAFQGSADTTQPALRMEQMIAALMKAGGTPRYTEIPGGPHAIWNDVYQMPALYQWMFSQKIPKGRAGKF